MITVNIWVLVTLSMERTVLNTSLLRTLLGIHKPLEYEKKDGESVCCTLPAVDTDYMNLILKADKGMSSEYKLLYEKKITRHAPKGMNM